MMYQRPVWAEIDLSAISHNVRRIKSLLQRDTRLCAVVKADAYGHGAVPVAKAVLEAGASQLAVAILSEGIELRKSGITTPILILGYTPPEQAPLVVMHNLSQTLFSWEMATALSHAATVAGTIAKVHVKLDTGMHRIGIPAQNAGDFITTIAVLPNVQIEGAYTHFATADSSNKAFCRKQFNLFLEALNSISARGLPKPLCHCANSAAILNAPETHLDMVRAGIAVYGLAPSPETNRNVDLRPAMQLKTRVAYVKKLPPGAPVSYGCTYVTNKHSRIATLPIGYADGWSRALSNKGHVLIRRERAPLVGRICMDQCMVDVTHISNVSPGEEVLLFGNRELPAEQIAELLGTINYEVVCMISKRVPRLYI